VESLAPEHLPGLADNVNGRFVAWSRAFVHSRHVEGEIGGTIYTLAQICRSRLTGRPVPADSADLIEARRGALVSRLGRTLADLRRERNNQQAYAKHALIIANFLSDQVAAASEQSPTDQAEDTAPLAILLDFDDGSDRQTGAGHGGANTALADGTGQYRIFTTTYDSERPVTQLVRSQQLVRFRTELDRTLDTLHV